MDADFIKQAVFGYYSKKLWLINYEVGLCKGGRYRADVVAANMGSRVVVVEVKSSVADFRTDKKMHHYLQYADMVMVAMSQEVFDKVKNDVHRDIGVFVVSSSGRARVAKRAKPQEMKPEVRLNILTRLAYRGADATRYKRKSKSAPAKFVALKAVEAIQAIPRKQRVGKKDFVVKRVQQAIEAFV